ncbi:PQQ-dependent sugar dehydrogenase [Pontibacter toksunensis]|uniref:PQQ-dependent sugar dehydrogenase n=1 Tax=Pontibacter toksunensis TaxID=1332631 RepID=A0ABW6C200_9BACT
MSKPTVLAFAPDDRIFIAEQGGRLRVIKNGSLLATPFMQLEVNSSGERGLIGIALDPNFKSNQFIYLYYTVSSGTIHNRVSRFTANGDVVLAGSEKIILELDPLSSATNHNGGALQFGKDGKLYIAVGDNANSANAQELDTYHGKVLRINADGSVPTGNPFTSGTEQRKRVWAFGLRNPYTFTFQTGTGRFFVNDVGEGSWEEINDASTGGLNFGWPGAEGNSTNPAYENPVHAYNRRSDTESGCAITGGAFYNPTTSNYPATYTGKYFYHDYCSNWINYIDISGSTAVQTKFASGLPGQSLSLTLGNDGNLYYLSRSAGALYKIIYVNTSAPSITRQPSDVTVTEGQSATFSVSASGTAPLNYQWQKNGANISGAKGATYTIASTTPASAGQYRVLVSNEAGSVTSNAATLTVTTYNAAPTAKVTSPVHQTLYRAGTVVSFTGTGTDPEDGTLPASAFSWSVEFHHDTHKHDGPPVASGVKSGTFTIPDEGETAVNVWYRLILTVTDSKGLKHSNYIDLTPKVVAVSLATSPVGLPLSLNNQPRTTPYTQNFVSGMSIPLHALPTQTYDGVSYQFSNWSPGTVAGGKITVPDVNTTYTASYSPDRSQELSGFTLMNADTDQPIAGYDPIATGATLNLADLPTQNLNIRANTTPANVGSVRFSFDGTENYRTESFSPYCIGGDQGNADYLPWALHEGSHTLTGTPFSGAGATGTVGTAKTITFTVVNTAIANCTATGSILREYWENVRGESTASIPVSSVPTFTSQLSSFEAPVNVADNYGQRLRGYICAPVSGNYTFYLASDDKSELWLSTTDNPADKVKIASVSGWTYPRQWDKYASQKSVEVWLEAGKRYYIEALHKEDWGLDNLAVAWQLPSGAIEAPIPGSRLSPVLQSQAASAQVVSGSEPGSESLLISYYPNPFEEEVTLQLHGKKEEKYSLKVYDVSGREVWHREDIAADKPLSLGKDFATGVYILQVSTGREARQYKLVKAR